MLKKRLYLRHFLASRRLMRLFANYFFWMRTSRFVIIEPTFCERGNFKTRKNFFIYLTAHKKYLHLFVFILNAENVGSFYAERC